MGPALRLQQHEHTLLVDNGDLRYVFRNADSLHEFYVYERHVGVIAREMLKILLILKIKGADNQEHAVQLAHYYGEIHSNVWVSQGAVELTLELSKLLQAYVVGRAQKDAEDARLLAEFADLVDISGLRQAEKDELFSVFQNYQHCAETILQQIKDKTESVEQEARPGKYRMREKYNDELRTFANSFTLRLKSFFDDRYDARAAVCLWDYNFKL